MDNFAGFIGWYIAKYIYFFVIAFALIVIENKLEVKYKFAKKIHNLRIKSRFTSFVFGGKEISGYFIFVMIGLFLFLHIPFLITASWSIGAESEIFAVLLLAGIFWDFLWVVLNPYYGVRKFNQKHLYWYEAWVAGIPVEYARTFGLAAMISLLDYPFGIGKIAILLVVFGIASCIVAIASEFYRGLQTESEN
ncbi:hypothetical protein KKD70_02980 [Patescibacteria group bacterium]|nr:hypothetical protein [Patescibacteria group bacterium]